MLNRALLILSFLASGTTPVLAQSCSGNNCLVISQIFGGGGNANGPFRNDFIEIFNRGGSPVPLTGFSVQYASANGISWQVTNLTPVTLAAGQYYLVQESLGANAAAPALPSADATGSIAMSAASGQVALVSDTTPLSSSCPVAGATVIDIVGYGGSACTPSTGALSNPNAALRNMNGCYGGVKPSASNGAAAPVSGFTVAAPSPRNTSSTLNPCGVPSGISFSPSILPAGVAGSAYSQTFTASGGNGGYTYSFAGNLSPGLTLSTAGVLSGTPATTAGSPFSFTVTVTDGTSSATQNYSLTINGVFTCPVTNSIAQIQGSGLTSPLVNTTVTASGTVTAVRSNGFYFQMPSPGDNNSSTSDAMFVFTSSAPGTAAALGNLVCVTGTIQEFTPDAGYSSITEFSGSPMVNQISTGNTLPAPVVLTMADFSPTGGLYQREKYEGMRVSVSSLTVVAPTQGRVNEANATATSTGIFFGVLPGVPRPFREPGVDAYDILPPGSPATIPVWDNNPELLRVNTADLTGSVALNVTSGATVSNLVGVVDYKFGQYTLLTEPATPPSAIGNVAFTAVPVPLANDLTIASFNLERFYDSTDDAGGDVKLTPTAFDNRLSKASLAIRNVLRTPDILGLEEVENLATLQTLAAKIDSDAVAASQTPPHYQAYLQPGNDVGNINNAFLVKSAKVTVVSVTQYGKSATYLDPTTGAPAVLNDRPPLVLKATAKAAGSSQALALTVIVNHLRSLIGVNDDTVSGMSTTGMRVRAKREAAAEFLANLIQSFQAAGEKVVAVGDFNAYQVNDGYVDVVGVVRGNPAPPNQDVVPGASGLVSPVLSIGADLVPASQKYSYTFDGTAQILDQFLYTQSLDPIVRQVAYGRVDADFPDIYRNDPSRPERVSDHDPVIGYLTLPVGSTAPVDVTAQTTISGSGLTFNRATQISSGTLTVTNKGSQTITGPIEIVLTNLSAGVTLVNAAGNSNGSPYVSTAGPLAPNASVTLTVQFTTMGNARIGYTPKVYSGAF